MCFYNDDYDWYASVTTDETSPATKPTKCDECRRVIPIGEPVRHIWMQQHEYCIHHPDYDDYEGDDSDGTDCPEGCEHDYGETYDYDCCETCTQLVEAIHKSEIESGCRDAESRPNLTELYDAFAEGEGSKYLAKAEELYPGIRGRMAPEFVAAAERTHDD